MRAELILVGKTTDRHFAAGIDDYTERLKHYMPFEMRVIPELKNTKNLSTGQQKDKEGEAILRTVGEGDTVVLLDEHGKEMRSVEFASWLQKKQATARKLVFVIGGPYGFSSAVYFQGQRADKPFEDDVLPSDGETRLCRATLQGLHDNKRREIPS